MRMVRGAEVLEMEMLVVEQVERDLLGSPTGSESSSTRPFECEVIEFERGDE